MAKIPDSTWKALTQREREVVILADDLLDWIRSSSKLSSDVKKSLLPTEAGIDAQFLFRFDPDWSKRARQIRRQMAAVPGYGERKSLSPQDKKRWWEHLRQIDKLEITHPGEALQVLDTPILYRPLDPSLREMVYETRGGVLLVSEKDDTTWQERWAEELNLFFDVLSALYALGFEFNVVPMDIMPGDRWTQALKDQVQRIACWVLHERGCRPLFPWPLTRLDVRETGQEDVQTIRPREWAPRTDGELERRGGRMSLEVRTRTWTIYYLSTKGGGHWTPMGAVQLWNEIYPDTQRSGLYPNPYNYQIELDRLLQKGTLKEQ